VATTRPTSNKRRHRFLSRCNATRLTTAAQAELPVLLKGKGPRRGLTSSGNVIRDAKGAKEVSYINLLRRTPVSHFGPPFSTGLRSYTDIQPPQSTLPLPVFV
jgi:hypothetical protein